MAAGHGELITDGARAKTADTDRERTRGVRDSARFHPVDRLTVVGNERRREGAAIPVEAREIREALLIAIRRSRQPTDLTIRDEQCGQSK